MIQRVTTRLQRVEDQSAICVWLFIIALMMNSHTPSETSVNFYQSIRRNNPEESHLHDEITLRFYYKLRITFRIILFRRH
jgi:hypothetical protein